MYLDLAAAKHHLGITGTADDGYIEALIAAATDIIDAHCGRHFERRAATHRYDHAALRGTLLILDDDLVDALDMTVCINGDGTTIPPDQIVPLPHNTSPSWGLTLRGGRSWVARADQPIVIDAVWGYSATPPPAVVQACRELVADLYRADDRQTSGLGKGAEAFSQTRDLPPRVLAMLRPYVRRSL